MSVQRTGRLTVGTLLDLPGHGLCDVANNSAPSLLTLLTEQGTELRIGEKALRLALMALKVTT